MTILDQNTSSQIQIDIDIDTQFAGWDSYLPKISSLAEEVSRAVFKITKFDHYVKHIEFSIILSEDHRLQELNKDYRGEDKPTNVLSFPAEDILPSGFENVQTHDGFVLIGDIIFAFQTLKSEADSSTKSFEGHFCHLLVHGLLHLLGYDHETESDAVEMEAIEVEVLTKFNINSPYQDHS